MQNNNLYEALMEKSGGKCVCCDADNKLQGNFRAMLIKQYIDKVDLTLIGKDEFADGIIKTLDEFAFMLVQPRLSDEALQCYIDGKNALITDKDQLREIIPEIVYDVLGREYDCYPIICSDSVIFALRVKPASGERNVDERTEVFRTFEEYFVSKRMYFTQNLGFIPQVIASEIAEELRDLQKSVHTVTFFCDYVFNTYPKKKVATPLMSAEIDKYRCGNLIFKPEKEKKFFESIIDSNFYNARMLMKDIIVEERGLNAVVPIRERTHDRLRWVVSMLGVPGGATGRETGAIKKKADEAATCRSMEELFRIIDEFFDAMESYHWKSDNNRGRKIKLVKQYIVENYADQDLCVGTLCDVFKVSPEHLSRTFRKETGIKLIDFIHLTRLSRAKEVVREQMGFGEIAMRVGYSGEWTLARTFKRFEGVTPREYRQSISKNKI